MPLVREQTASKQETHRLSWESVGSTILGLSPIPIGRTAWKEDVTIGLCKKHRNRCLAWKLGTVLGFPSFLIGGIALMIQGPFTIGFGVVASAFLIPVFGLLFGRVVSAGRISDDGMELAGAGRPFLKTLPAERTMPRS